MNRFYFTVVQLGGHLFYELLLNKRIQIMLFVAVSIPYNVLNYRIYYKVGSKLILINMIQSNFNIM